jgi:VanZ family protein
MFRLVFAVALALTSYLAIADVAHTPVASLNDKLMHALAFCALAFLLDFSLPDSSFLWNKALVLLAYGLFIEVIQWRLPYREFSLLDLAADGTGLAAYCGCLPLIKRFPLLSRRWS